MAGPGKPGRRGFEPNAAQIENARIARTAGANLDAISESILGITPKTLYLYLARHRDPKTGEQKSELGKALTRAWAARQTVLPGLLYQVATDPKHPRQVDALKFILARQGGDEWKERVEIAGDPHAPLLPQTPRKPLTDKETTAMLAALEKARRRAK